MPCGQNSIDGKHLRQLALGYKVPIITLVAGTLATKAAMLSHTDHCSGYSCTDLEQGAALLLFHTAHYPGWSLGRLHISAASHAQQLRIGSFRDNNLGMLLGNHLPDPRQLSLPTLFVLTPWLV